MHNTFEFDVSAFTKPTWEYLLMFLMWEQSQEEATILSRPETQTRFVNLIIRDCFIFYIPT